MFEIEKPDESASKKVEKEPEREKKMKPEYTISQEEIDELLD